MLCFFMEEPPVQPFSNFSVCFSWASYEHVDPDLAVLGGALSFCISHTSPEMLIMLVGEREGIMLLQPVLPTL